MVLAGCGDSIPEVSDQIPANQENSQKEPDTNQESETTTKQLDEKFEVPEKKEETPVTVGPQSGNDEERELIQLVKEKLTEARPELLPSVLIFPVVNEQQEILPVGPALSYIASCAVMFGADQAMEMSPIYSRKRLAAGGCAHVWSVIDDLVLDRMLTALNPKFYLVPELRETDDGYILNYKVIQNDETGTVKKSFEHVISYEEVIDVSRVIALDVFDALEVEITEEQEQWISNSGVNSIQALIYLGDEYARPRFINAKQDFVRLLTFNPNCLAAWLLFIFETGPYEELQQFSEQYEPEFDNDFYQFVHMVRAQTTLDSFKEELRLIRQIPYEPGFYWAIYNDALTFKYEALAEEILQIWKEQDPGYSGCLTRAEMYQRFARNVRQGRPWYDMTQEEKGSYGYRLRQAKEENELALKANPRGWEAHGNLLGIAMQLGESEEVAKKHFEGSREIYPNSFQLYRNRLLQLSSRWGGTPEQVLEFAMECARSPYWTEKVPYVALDCLSELCYDFESKAYKRSPHLNPEFYKVLKAFEENLDQNPPRHWCSMIGPCPSSNDLDV